MKTFYRTAGVLSILSGSLGMIGYAFSLMGNGSILVPMPVGPKEIIDLYSRPLFQSSILVNMLSILFIFPAVVGMGFVLREKSPALAMHGAIAGVLGFLCLLVQNTLDAGLMSVVTGHEPCATGVSREHFAAILYNIDQFFMLPALGLTGVFYLLFGLGFSKFTGTAFWAGRVFLAEVALMILTVVFFIAQTEVPASLAILAQVLATGIGYILAGTTMIRDDQE